ncbi:MAG TPA: hypothetical protein VH595_01485 [Verrucomicrobiae bacterium]|jgi:hypothetical protein|nr:hypothetical protein [Verrucomicrobiae bacterium]
MLNHRQRFLASAAACIAGIWVAAMAGHWYFESIKVTADKVRAYAQSVDFGQLTGAARAKALKQLEDKLNALSYKERQRLRMEHFMSKWFAEMTPEEQEQFIDATLPTGFKQMITAYEQLPEDKRHKVIDDAMKNLRKEKNEDTNNLAQTGANAPPPVSPEVEAKIREIGLNSFYSQSSAQTKAEVAPLLEEMQRTMESGKVQLRP